MHWLASMYACVCLPDCFCIRALFHFVYLFIYLFFFFFKYYFGVCPGGFVSLGSFVLDSFVTDIVWQYLSFVAVTCSQHSHYRRRRRRCVCFFFVSIFSIVYCLIDTRLEFESHYVCTIWLNTWQTNFSQFWVWQNTLIVAPGALTLRIFRTFLCSTFEIGCNLIGLWKWYKRASVNGFAVSAILLHICDWFVNVVHSLNIFVDPRTCN